MFDWDGSLADTLPIWFGGYKKIFSNYGIKTTNAVIAKEIIGDWSGPERLGIGDTKSFFDDMENEVLEKLNKAKLNPGVMELLKYIIEKGGKVAVVTASRKRWVKTALRNNGLREIVSVFLGKEDVTYVKPDPESLLKALKLLGGNVNEAIMIGDNGKDVIAGRTAGMDTALYYPKTYREFYTENIQQKWGSTYIFEDFGELVNLI